MFANEPESSDNSPGNISRLEAGRINVCYAVPCFDTVESACVDLQKHTHTQLTPVPRRDTGKR